MRQWIAENRPLTMEEMQNNALIICQYLTQKHGWSIEAVSAVLGNMVYESWVNPGVWEDFNYGNLYGGYGLIQWTPATKYTNWAGANWATNHYLQLDRLHYESTCGTEFWVYRDLYPGWTYEAFRTSHEDPYDLACIFAWYAEGSAVVIYGGPINEAPYLSEEQKEANREKLRRERGNTALDWYEFLLNNPLPPPNQRKRMPIWMMCKPIR